MTIYALGSGRGKAGIAIVRVSGPKAGPAVEALTKSYVPPPATARLRKIVDPGTGEEIDRGLVLFFQGPETYTGEDVAEFHVHGGPAVVGAVLGALGRVDGLRPAEPGEFTRRGFENGRLDLTRAEAIGDLVNAETENQRRQALRQMEGAQGRLYEGWRGEILKSLAWIEAVIDFPDEKAAEEDSEEVLGNAWNRLDRLKGEIEEHLEDGRVGERVREGFRVAIVGPPNVGKSSLLNALARREAAIVSDIAGTTRDVVEVRLEIGGFLMTVADTAGLRESVDPIEQEGTRRARAAARHADVALVVRDAGNQENAPAEEDIEAEERWIVWNKVDLLRGEAFKRLSKTDDGGIFVSAVTGGGISGLEKRLVEFVEAQGLGDSGDAVITRARHRKALESAVAHLGTALEDPEQELELTAEEVRLAARDIGRITGRVDVEDLLDVVFRDFCIGK
jgi:tRNA modification GTPase